MGKRAFIFAAGEHKADDLKLYKRIKIHEDDLILCADGGYDTLALLGTKPDVVIGDLDSVRTTIPPQIKTVKYPSDKDKTDLEICIDYAAESGCDSLLILGALGGRVDHSLASLYAMRYALEKGMESMILSAHTRVYLVSDYLKLSRESFDYISLIPCTDKVSGVTTSGLKYNLENATLHQSSSLGVSNEFYNNTALIKIEKGLLFVICLEE